MEVKEEERYEVDFAVDELLDNMHRNALKLLENTHNLMQCKDGTRFHFELIIALTRAIGTDGNTLRRFTVGKKKDKK